MSVIKKVLENDLLGPLVIWLWILIMLALTEHTRWR